MIISCKFAGESLRTFADEAEDKPIVGHKYHAKKSEPNSNEPIVGYFGIVEQVVEHIDEGNGAASNSVHHRQWEIQLGEGQSKKVEQNERVNNEQPLVIFGFFKSDGIPSHSDDEIIEKCAHDPLSDVDLEYVELVLVCVYIRGCPYNAGNCLHQVGEVVMIVRQCLFFSPGD